MSAPAAFACAIAALCLAVPVIGAGAQLESDRRADALADAAALAAADALGGWAEGEPCALAAAVATSAGAGVTRCELDAAQAQARVVVAVDAPLGTVSGSARAGPERLEPSEAPGGPVGADGWAWPSAQRGVTQGHHDGLAIDLSVGGPGGDALYAPYDGVVVAAGPDGGGIPAVCRANPWWWHGPNHTVLIRHAVGDRVIYSSHNHIAPGSAAALGIAAGSAVRAGQAVARAGMSGCTSGPHTHFTLASSPVNAFPDLDPFAYLGAP
ncbi:M23 family metallopeptidase [Leucobacter allii]|uniref:M23 family metallopeptidase n=1 Tax=Leucobacter allii TaxID=2932247 RepID=A0ABY4FIK5_9MICO|nr:M23 family metallopeptidase [Leucobacter allii]UOQ56527.1 M23 family metallopeptidase [Leucobacter allii]